MIIAIIGLIGTKDQLIEMSDADNENVHAKLTIYWR